MTIKDCEIMLASLENEILDKCYPKWLTTHCSSMKKKLSLVKDGYMTANDWVYKFKIGCDVAKSLDMK